MARTRSKPPGRGAARTAALVVAGVVAAAATGAVVLADDPQVLRLAVVGALWAFVLAAFAVPRRREPDAGPLAGAAPGTDLELRRKYEVELEREVAARREYELQLEVYLRRELERGLAEDVAGLRDEVARMRGEMIDRLDGELRMERIETTRLIGGSLRALQDEAARLGIGLPIPGELTAAPEPRFGERQYPDLATDQVPAAAPSPVPPYVPPPPPEPYGRAADEPLPPARQPGYLPPRDPEPAPYPPAGREPAYLPPAPRRPEPAYPAGQAEPAYLPPAPREPEPAYGHQPPAGPADEAPRRRRARADDEDNEVMSRLLGR